MKYVFIAFVLTVIFASKAYAQQKDTDSIKIFFEPLLELNDSLLYNKNSLKLTPLKDGYDKQGKQWYSESEYPISFYLDEPASKRSGALKSSYTRFIVPVALISYGVATRNSHTLRELDYNTYNTVNKNIKRRTHVDDYLQYAPSAAALGLDFVGIRAKNNFRDRSIVMATSYIIMSASVQTMKRTTNVERPDGADTWSFPSGHTATAFVGAQILFREYKDSSFWIVLAGYSAATATGAMRVINKKHWVSDVVAGAGVGMLSVEVSYLLLPVFQNMFGVSGRDSKLVLLPTVGANMYGVGLAYTF